MPYWLESLRTEVSAEERSDFKVLLTKMFDVDMGPFPFLMDRLYHFVIERFTDTTPMTQQQALLWIQLLSSLDIVIPMQLLLDIFRTGAKSLGEVALEEVGTVSEPPMISETVTSQDDYGITSPTDYSSTGHAEEGMQFVMLTYESRESELNMTCFTYMLDIMLKQTELSKAPIHAGVANMRSKQLLTLVNVMLQSTWTGNHTCQKLQSCEFCNSMALWFKLLSQIIKNIVPSEMHRLSTFDVLIDKWPESDRSSFESDVEIESRLSEFPPHLQLTWLLLKVLSLLCQFKYHTAKRELNEHKSDCVLQYLTETLNLILTHTDALSLALKDNANFVKYCIGKYLIPGLWRCLRAEQSHIAMHVLPLFLYALTLPNGADLFWDILHSEFYSDVWQDRFGAVERVTVLSRFLNPAMIKKNQIIYMCLAHAFSLVIGAVDDKHTCVKQRAHLYLETIKYSSLKFLCTCLEWQFNHVPFDRTLILKRFQVLNTILKDTQIFSWDFFLARYDCLSMETQFALEKSGDISGISDICGSNHQSEAFLRKLDRVKFVVKHGMNSPISSIARSAELSTDYRRPVAIPTRIVGSSLSSARDICLTKTRLNRLASYQLLVPMIGVMERSGLSGLAAASSSTTAQSKGRSGPTNTSNVGASRSTGIGVMAGSAFTGGMLREFTDEESNFAIQLFRGESLEGCDRSTLYYLTVLLLNYMGDSDQSAVAEDMKVSKSQVELSSPWQQQPDSCSKVESYVLRHFCMLVGYTQPLGACQTDKPFCLPPYKIRCSAVFNAILSNLPTLLDKNMNVGVILLQFSLQLLLYCPSPQLYASDSAENYTLWLLEPNMRLSWLSTLLIILYKYDLSDKGSSKNVDEDRFITVLEPIIRIVLNTLEAQFHVCSFSDTDFSLPSSHRVSRVSRVRERSGGSKQLIPRNLEVTDKLTESQMGSDAMKRSTSSDPASRSIRGRSEEKNGEKSIELQRISRAKNAKMTGQNVDGQGPKVPTDVQRPPSWFLAVDESSGSEMDLRDKRGSSLSLRRDTTKSSSPVQPLISTTVHFETETVQQRTSTTQPSKDLELLSLAPATSPINLDDLKIAPKAMIDEFSLISTPTPHSEKHVLAPKAIIDEFDSINLLDDTPSQKVPTATLSKIEIRKDENDLSSSSPASSLSKNGSAKKVSDLSLTPNVKESSKIFTDSDQVTEQPILTEKVGELEAITKNNSLPLPELPSVPSCDGSVKTEYPNSEASEPDRAALRKERIDQIRNRTYRTPVKSSMSRMFDEIIFNRCSQCKKEIEQYDDETLGYCIVVLEAFIYIDPGAAAPLLFEIIQTVARLASDPHYSWQMQTQNTTLVIPGNTCSVARQFLRCTFHQLAPSGIFPQLFQSHVEDTELWKTISTALQDFQELNSFAPIFYLLEGVNKRKTLPTGENLLTLLLNLATYLDYIPLENANTPQWTAILAQLDIFFRKLPSVLTPCCNMTNMMKIMSAVLKTPGVQSCRTILEPFSKLINFNIQSSSVHLNQLLDICCLNNRNFTRDRDRLVFTRCVIYELIQCIRFKSTISDENMLLLVQFVLLDAGGSILETNIIDGDQNKLCVSYLQQVYIATGARDCFRQYMVECIDFIADLHTINKIKSISKSGTISLNEDTLGYHLKAGIAQFIALEITQGNGSSENHATKRFLPWLYHPPSALQQGPREFIDCIDHVRLLSWILIGSLSHAAVSENLTNICCVPIPLDATIYVADHILVIMTGFAQHTEKSKASTVLHMSALFHAFMLCQLWTMYCETFSMQHHIDSVEQAESGNQILDFWGRVTPGILQLLSHSEVKEMQRLAEMVNLHFLSLMEALQECQSTVLDKLFSLWTPILFSYHGQLPNNMKIRLQACQNRRPPLASEQERTHCDMLLQWLKRLQFKLGQIEVQSSQATQLYTI